MDHILGAHMSISGGLHQALLAGRDAGCNAIQLFSKSSNQWHAKPLQPDDIACFKKTREETGVWPAMIHAAYLINLCAPQEAAWQKAVDAFYLEMERAEALEIPYLVVHPGAHVGSGEEAGIARAAKALNEVHRRALGFQLKILIELTAGQGSCIGHRFEHVAKIFDQTDQSDRMGVCLDTAHVFAAGYDLQERYEETLHLFDQQIGLERIKAFHINDCKKELGCRVDRHEHIGQGKMGLAPFSHLMNDSRFIGLPMILETPKGENLEEDRMNLATLRGLMQEKTAAFCQIPPSGI